MPWLLPMLLAVLGVLFHEPLAAWLPLAAVELRLLLTGVLLALAIAFGLGEIEARSRARRRRGGP